MAVLKSLWRYPIKGLSGERLTRVRLNAGDYFPHDRLYAFENGESGFDGTKHLSKTHYVMLARQAAMAKIQSHYDDKTQEISLSFAGESLTASPLSEEGRLALSAFIAQKLENEGLNPVTLLTSPRNMRFTDSALGFVSLINLESVRALEKAMGQPLDPLRFRGNLLIENLPALSELDLINFRLQIGDVFFKVLKRTDRCAATMVNPKTGARDAMIPSTLMRLYGHADCGVYLETVQGGEIEEGMRVKIHEAPTFNLPFA